MKNALIINGGNNTTNRDQIGEFDYIVAVDSGAEHAYKLFLKPDLIIGDLDSISTKTYDRVIKDKIDFSLGIFFSFLAAITFPHVLVIYKMKQITRKN